MLIANPIFMSLRTMLMVFHRQDITLIRISSQLTVLLILLIMAIKHHDKTPYFQLTTKPLEHKWLIINFHKILLLLQRTNNSTMFLIDPEIYHSIINR